MFCFLNIKKRVFKWFSLYKIINIYRTSDMRLILLVLQKQVSDVTLLIIFH